MVHVSALADAQVAALYDHVSSSGELYCKSDLECLMRQFEIKASRHRGNVSSISRHTPVEVVSQLLQEGLLRSQRFKNVTVIWCPVPPASEDGKKVEVPATSSESDNANLKLRCDELKEELAKLEATKGSSDSMREKGEIIRHEIKVLEEQNAAKRKEAAANLDGERRETAAYLTRLKTSTTLLQKYVSDTYLVSNEA
ncbi:peptidase M23, putative [Babesia ovata]|uniref:Peptidase M23, putative n=1 Tax=Babesia ovata TaxID=189622 RepID=A0A2H6KHQ9_9APIC|nr:peptidase M23, putative [Babesia ovata]GBE62525.1 peptidase M23, putative [Babesia ovata]